MSVRFVRFDGLFYFQTSRSCIARASAGNCSPRLFRTLCLISAFRKVRIPHMAFEMSHENLASRVRMLYMEHMHWVAVLSRVIFGFCGAVLFPPFRWPFSHVICCLLSRSFTYRFCITSFTSFTIFMVSVSLCHMFAIDTQCARCKRASLSAPKG